MTKVKWPWRVAAAQRAWEGYTLNGRGFISGNGQEQWTRKHLATKGRGFLVVLATGRVGDKAKGLF